MIFMYANIPVNQQLFATTLFPDEPAINWFAHVLLLPYGEYWSGARNIRDNEAQWPVAQNSMIRVPL